MRAGISDNFFLFFYTLFKPLEQWSSNLSNCVCVALYTNIRQQQKKKRITHLSSKEVVEQADDRNTSGRACFSVHAVRAKNCIPLKGGNAPEYLFKVIGDGINALEKIQRIGVHPPREAYETEIGNESISLSPQKTVLFKREREI